jgi:hypothetical protein
MCRARRYNMFLNKRLRSFGRGGDDELGTCFAQMGSVLPCPRRNGVRLEHGSLRESDKTERFLGLCFSCFLTPPI